MVDYGWSRLNSVQNSADCHAADMAEIDCHAAVIVAVAAHVGLTAAGGTVAGHLDYHGHLGCHLDSLNNCWNCSGSPVPVDSVGTCCYFHAAISVNCGHRRLNWITNEIKEEHKMGHLIRNIYTVAISNSVNSCSCAFICAPEQKCTAELFE